MALNIEISSFWWLICDTQEHFIAQMTIVVIHACKRCEIEFYFNASVFTRWMISTGHITINHNHIMTGFTNVSWALQHNIAKIYNATNHIYGEMLIGSTISATHKFRENILESSQNVRETTPWLPVLTRHWQTWYWLCKTGRSLSSMKKEYSYPSLIYHQRKQEM